MRGCVDSEMGLARWWHSSAVDNGVHWVGSQDKSFGLWTITTAKILET